MGTEKDIADQLIEIEESYTYLGILKDLPLMDAMQAFEKASAKIIKLSERIWKEQEFPDRRGLFTELGEDYDEIEKLLHANDALDPIYNGLKQIFRYLEQLRDDGVSLAEAQDRLGTIMGKSR